MAIFQDDVQFQGNVRFAGTRTPAFQRSELNLDTSQVYIVPWEHFRVWDAINMPLPSEGLLEAAITDASYFWDPTGADDSFFVAGRAYRVLGITARVEVVGTDGGAVTAVIRKAASGTDIASGTALHTGSINLKGTVDTNQTLSLSATSSDLDIASGTCIGIDFTGTLTSARGCVTVLLAPASSPDDLRLVGGAFGTNTPSIQTPDLKTAGASTRYARFQFRLPAEYVAGENVQIRLHAGMLTHVADTTATIDVECYKSDRERGLGADLCTTSAQSINSTTLADKSFTITGTGLSPGDVLDVRVTIAVNDAASGSAVIGCLSEAAVLLNIRG